MNDFYGFNNIHDAHLALGKELLDGILTSNKIKKRRTKHLIIDDGSVWPQCSTRSHTIVSMVTPFGHISYVESTEVNDQPIMVDMKTKTIFELI